MHNIKSILCIAMFILCMHKVGATKETCIQWCACDASYGIGIKADYLYWSAIQDKMYYAAAIPDPGLIWEYWDGAANFIPSNWYHENILEAQKPTYSPGVRLALSYDTSPMYNMGYSCTAIWTRLHQNSESTASGASGTIVPILLSNVIWQFVQVGLGNAVSFTDFASSQWNLSFDTLDLIFGSDFCLGERFHFIPYIGGKGARVNQMQRVVFQNIANVVVKHNFSGVGPLMGVDATAAICRRNYFDLDILARLSTAVLCAYVSNNNSYHVAIPGQQTPSFFTRDNNLWVLRPTAQMFLGMQYAGRRRNCKQVLLELGYEAQIWAGQWNNVASFSQATSIPSTTDGSLVLQGLTASASMRF